MCSSAIFFASAWHSFFLLSLVSQHYRIVFGFFVLFLSVVFLQLARFFFLRFLLSVVLLGPQAGGCPYGQRYGGYAVGNGCRPARL